MTQSQTGRDTVFPLRAVGTARGPISAADSADCFFDHCPAFGHVASAVFPNHKVHLRISLVWLAW